VNSDAINDTVMAAFVSVTVVIVNPVLTGTDVLPRWPRLVVPVRVQLTV